ncbi:MULTISPECIES: hypothetical protein [Bacillaceae]|uniref:Uncharacterized protein n=1 Tax=Metabacillus sediminis TaxID=3117746 RepID=A0ABZ2NL23_9BACI|nr:hypothetical protein [Bacillus sp. SJS]KZZ83677.1 hypothetical protein AS29_015340 [Bacillus sp. SJS]
MSWIAPIQNDQYIQYANRSVQVKDDYASLDRVSKIHLQRDKMEEERKHEESRFSRILDRVKQSSTHALPSEPGKGLSFDARI